MGVGVSRPRRSHSLAFAPGSPASLALPRSPSASVAALTRLALAEGRHFGRRAAVLYCHAEDIPATVALVQAARRLAVLQPTRLIVVRYAAPDGSWPVALVSHRGVLHPHPPEPTGESPPFRPPVHERDGTPVYTLPSGDDVRSPDVLLGWQMATRLREMSASSWALVADTVLPVLIGVLGALPLGTSFRWVRWGRRLVPLLRVDASSTASALPLPSRRTLLL